MQRTQHLQNTLEAKHYGHLSIGCAAALMLVVFCPMSMIAVGGAYWTHSIDAHGTTVSTSVSLWTVSTLMETRGESKHSEMDMCGENLQDFDDCGKIHALRFFTITTLLSSLASSSMLIAAFSPFLKDKPWLREKILLAGASVAGCVCLWNFLSICIAAGVDMGDSYNLSGAGFVCIILDLLFVILALALATNAMRKDLLSVVRKPSGVEDEKEHPQASHHARNAPILLGVCPTGQLVSTKMEIKGEQPEAAQDDQGLPTVVVADVSGQNSAKAWAPIEKPDDDLEEIVV